MTFSLRRNRQTTAQAASRGAWITTRCRAWLGVLGCSVALLSPCAAQTPPGTPPPKPTLPSNVDPNDPLAPIRFQNQPGSGSSLFDPATRGYQVQLEVPSLDRVFRAESDSDLIERIRQEYRQRDERAEFPKTAKINEAVKRVQYRDQPPQACRQEPYYVPYQPLYFEEKNSERYGWELGVLQPLVSTLYFYKDVALLPYHATINPPWRCETNTGYYWPGQPVPYYLYVPPFSWTATAAQVGTVVGGAAIFP